MVISWGQKMTSVAKVSMWENFADQKYNELDADDFEPDKDTED
jgi:hypothetical protein